MSERENDGPFGEFGAFADLYVLFQRVREAGLQYTTDLAWLLPDEVLPGVTSAYGLPVTRCVDCKPGLILSPAARTIAGSGDTPT